MPGIPPSLVRDFFRAAASFYRQAPWRKVDEGEPVRVECEAVGHGPRFAVILGKRGRVKGLMLHDDWESYWLMAQRVLEYSFKGISGTTTLDLSWVPMERLQDTGPAPR